MPLKQDSSKAAFSRNVAELMKSGKRSQKQALAIAYRVQRGNQGKDRKRGRSIRPGKSKPQGRSIRY